MIWNCLLRAAAWDIPRWLCDAHVIVRREQREDNGNLRWLGVDQIVAVDGDCGDCELARQTAPGYRTPTPDFVPTAASSVHPRRAVAHG